MFNQVAEQVPHAKQAAKPSDAALDRVFHALASGPRREILRLTAHGPCTVTELAEQFDLSLAAVSRHVRVLDDADLLHETRDGRRRWRRINLEALEPVRATLEELRGYWNSRLDALEALLEAEAGGSADG